MRMPPKGSIERHLLWSMLLAGMLFALLLPLVGSAFAAGAAGSLFVLYWVALFSAFGR